MRIAILGNSGSGKSSLARRLSNAASAPTLDLDTIAWQTGDAAVRRAHAEAAADLHRFCGANPRWIVEGCYAGLIEECLVHRPVLIFLNPGVEQCIANCRNRPWEPHKYATRAEQDRNLAFLLSWVQQYPDSEGELSLKAHRAVVSAYGGPKHEVTDLRDLPRLCDELLAVTG